MARLTRAPTFFADRASKPANPAVPRCAPIQSAAATTKTSIARPPLSKSASARTTLRAGSKASQLMQSARNVLAVSSRTNLCAYRALSFNSSNSSRDADCAQKKYASKQQTRIPGPKISKTIAKWAALRKYRVIKYQVYIMKKKSEVQDYEEASFMSDTNPDLLHDESFDETRDPYKQSSMQTILSRFQALHNVLKHPKGVIGQYPGVLIPSYGGGDHFKLDRKRPGPVPVLKVARGNPQKVGSTLKYKKLDHAPAPSAKVLEQVKAEKHFGFGYKLRVEPNLEQDFLSGLASTVSDATISEVNKSRDDEPLTAGGVDVPSKSTSTKTSESTTSSKAVRFVEERAEPLLYHREAYAKDVKTLSEIDDDWTPIKRNCTYSSSSQSTGFDTMFMRTGLGTITLKRRVAIRFKAVQEYEKRRYQDSIDAGEHTALGQLDYGNADYRIAMQVSDVVTAHDIGTIVHPNKFNLPASMCRGPLLHFGGFAEDMGGSFENVMIPTGTATAYSLPKQWFKAPQDPDALDKWVASSFPALQPAKLEEYGASEHRD